MLKPSQVVFGSVAVVVVAAVLVCTRPAGSRADEQAREKSAGAAKLADKLIGTWTLEKAKSPGEPSGIGTRLKSFTGTHWMVTQPDPKTGEVVFHHGGRYTLEGDTVETTTDFAAESTKDFIGSKGSFQIKVDGDSLSQVDAKGVFDETWKRAK